MWINFQPLMATQISSALKDIPHWLMLGRFSHLSFPVPGRSAGLTTASSITLVLNSVLINYWVFMFEPKPKLFSPKCASKCAGPLLWSALLIMGVRGTAVLHPSFPTPTKHGTALWFGHKSCFRFDKTSAPVFPHGRVNYVLLDETCVYDPSLTPDARSSFLFSKYK